MTFTFDADGVGFAVETFVSSAIVTAVDAAIAGGSVCVTFKGQVSRVLHHCSARDVYAAGIVPKPLSCLPMLVPTE